MKGRLLVLVIFHFCFIDNSLQDTADNLAEYAIQLRRFWPELFDLTVQKTYVPPKDNLRQILRAAEFFYNNKYKEFHEDMKDTRGNISKAYEDVQKFSYEIFRFLERLTKSKWQEHSIKNQQKNYLMTYLGNVVGTSMELFNALKDYERGIGPVIKAQFNGIRNKVKNYSKKVRGDTRAYKNKIISRFDLLNRQGASMSSNEFTTLQNEKNELMKQSRDAEKQLNADGMNFDFETGNIKGRKDKVIEEAQKLEKALAYLFSPRSELDAFMNTLHNNLDIYYRGMRSGNLQPIINIHQNRTCIFPSQRLQKEYEDEVKTDKEKVSTFLKERKIDKVFRSSIEDLENERERLEYILPLMNDNDRLALIILGILTTILSFAFLGALAFMCYQNLKWFRNYNYNQAKKRGEVVTSYSVQMERARNALPLTPLRRRVPYMAQ